MPQSNIKSNVVFPKIVSYKYDFTITNTGGTQTQINTGITNGVGIPYLAFVKFSGADYVFPVPIQYFVSASPNIPIWEARIQNCYVEFYYCRSGIDPNTGVFSADAEFFQLDCDSNGSTVQAELTIFFYQQRAIIV